MGEGLDTTEVCRVVDRLERRSLAFARRREPLCETTIVRLRRNCRLRREVRVLIRLFVLTLLSFINLRETNAPFTPSNPC